MRTLDAKLNSTAYRPRGRLTRELPRQQITVNAVAPRFIDVGMSKGMPDEVTEIFKKKIPHWVKHLRS